MREVCGRVCTKLTLASIENYDKFEYLFDLNVLDIKYNQNLYVSPYNSVHICKISGAYSSDSGQI
jgi:hypothetical protein